MLFLLLSEFVCLQKNIPDRRKTVRDVSKRVTTLLSPPVACTALSPPPTRGRACNGAPPSRPVQAECSGASTTKRPHRLTPAAGSLSAGLPRLFPILAYCDITAYFISFLPIVKPCISSGYLKSDVGFFYFRYLGRSDCSKVLCGVFSFRDVRGKAVAVKSYVGFLSKGLPSKKPPVSE